MSKGLPTDPYKGVRDFYPADFAKREKIFSAWRAVSRRFGYEPYDASPLEATEIYAAKTGDEIDGEQTYPITARGDRSVALRPEMTPTVARMVAARRRDLAFPLRLYSIPNLFRYESPQRGRLREHYQWTCDVFGIPGIEAEVELIQMAVESLQSFGLKPENFEIRLNDRAALSGWFEAQGYSNTQTKALLRLLDKRRKIEDFDAQAAEVAGKPFVFEMGEPESVRTVREQLALRKITNVSFVPDMVRGFDYYTGVVFEVFEKSGKNPRSVAGGGRYDKLLEIFGEPGIPTAGFGMGDVVLGDVLEDAGLAAGEATAPAVTVIPLAAEQVQAAEKFADQLRCGRSSPSVAVDPTDRKLGDRLATAGKRGSKFAAIVGPKEAASGTATLKNLETAEQSAAPLTAEEFAKNIG